MKINQSEMSLVAEALNRWLQTGIEDAAQRAEVESLADRVASQQEHGPEHQETGT